uniref:hypothetical protein n=1 Tax=Salmonella enterica TaxID=28901 RepID=UPI002666C42B
TGEDALLSQLNSIAAQQSKKIGLPEKITSYNNLKNKLLLYCEIKRILSIILDIKTQKYKYHSNCKNSVNLKITK